MGVPQQFLTRLRTALTDRFPSATGWVGGQGIANTAALKADASLRRGGLLRSGERFELGDHRCTVGSATIIAEYESEGVALHHLLKYWPHLRGEMSTRPHSAIILCHFSSWSSYGSYRDLWNWLASLMKEDRSLLVKFTARQFDHWGADLASGEQSIAECLDWIESEALQVATASPRDAADPASSGSG
jgi:hypothetical protein